MSLRRSLETVASAADVAGTGCFRWVTTDHTGLSRMLSNIPSMGFLSGLRYILVCFALSVLVTLARAAVMFFAIAIWIPLLLWVVGWVLFH